MAAVNYRDGIAILQLIAFPVVLVTALLIGNGLAGRLAEKAGDSSNDTDNIFIAEAVCELIGIAPLILTYIGLVGQIDTEDIIPPRFTKLVTLAGFVGLILGIVGVTVGDSTLPYRPNGEVKAAMSIFLVVFVVMIMMTVRLAFRLRITVSSWQKKLFLGSILSWPFVLIRLVYSAIGDYSGNARFAILTGNNNIYLFLDVLPEIIAMLLCVAFGRSAVFDKHRKRVAVGEARDGLEIHQGRNGGIKSSSRSV